VRASGQGCGWERGAASVESIGLALLIVLLVAAVAAAAVSGPLEGGRELASTVGRKIRCATQLPGPCWRDPLTLAYGRPLGGLVRALAPSPAARPGPSGAGLLPVDFRVCRRESCAMSIGSPRVTRSNRRVTAFTSVRDRRLQRGQVEVTYWLYRPTLGWERVERTADSADVVAAAPTPLLETQNPALTPLETLPGRNHYDFAPGEEPPWRWRVPSVYP
jgi:hypothetical protein